MNRNFFDGTDAELYVGAKNCSTKVSQTPTAYGLTQLQADMFDAAVVEWSTKYETSQDPATRTKSAVAAKNAARAMIRAKASDLAKIIDGTPTVTDAQKIDLGLCVPKVPAPIPAPVEAPAVDLVSAIGRAVVIRVHAAPAITGRGKPPGAAAAWIYTFVGESFPAELSSWLYQGAATRGKFEITFPDSLPAGQQVWIKACWVNPRQQMGPMSDPITTNLQGGGTVPVQQGIRIAA